MILTRLASAVGIVLGVHGLVFVMLSLLPDAAIRALGLFGGNDTAVANFWLIRDRPSYIDHLTGVFRGDFGNTLDGVRVTSEIASALQETGPVFLLSLVATAATALLLFKWPTSRLRDSVKWFDLGALVPPFMIPFAISAALFASPFADSAFLAKACLAISIFIPCASMAGAYAARHQIDEMGAGYPALLARNGAIERDVRRLVAASSASYLMSRFDRIVILGLVCVMLAEPTLGLPGIGTLSARAVKTADPNLLLGLSMMMALLVALSGVLAAWCDQLLFGRLSRSL